MTCDPEEGSQAVAACGFLATALQAHSFALLCTPAGFQTDLTRID